MHKNVSSQNNRKRPKDVRNLYIFEARAWFVCIRETQHRPVKHVGKVRNKDTAQTVTRVPNLFLMATRL